MPDIARLGIRIDSDDVPRAKRNLDELEPAGARAEQTTSKLESSWSKFSRTIITVNQGLQLATRVFGTVSRSIGGLTSAWESNEQATVRMESAWRAAGGASGLTVRELNNLTTELHNLSGIATQTIEESLALAQTFHNISGDTFPATIQAAADLATIMGGDMTAAMQQVAFAVNDPIQGVSRLTRSGIQFTDVQREMIREFVELGEISKAQAIVLGEVESQFGGAAAAMRDSARGSRMAWEETMSFLRSTAGQAIEDALRPGREAIINWVADNREEIGLVFANFPEFAGLAFQAAVQIAERLFSYDTFSTIFARVGETLVSQIQAAIRTMARLGAAVTDGLIVAAEMLGENWYKALINGLQKTVDAPGRAILRLFGIELPGVQPVFDYDGPSLGEAIFAGIGTAATEAGDAYMGYVRDSVENFKALGADIAVLFDDIVDDMASKMSTRMAELKAERDATLSDLPGPGQGLPDSLGGAGLNEEVIRLMEALRDQAAVAGMSAEAIQLYRLEVAGATEEHIREAVSLQEVIQEKQRNAETLSRSAEIYARMAGLGGQWQAQLDEIHDEYQSGAITIDEYARKLGELEDASERAIRKQTEFEQAVENLNVRMIENAVTGFADALVDVGTAFGDGSVSAKTFGEAVGGVARQLTRMIPTMAVATGLKMLFEGDQRGWMFLGAGAAGLLGAGVMEGAISRNAHGNVFAGGQVQAFAQGGAFTNSIVSSPTLFPMARGMGLMGEAGPEAVMPLTRTPNGDLGVRATGGNTYVTVINNAADSSVRTEEQTDASGDRQIRVFVENIVEQGVSSGRFDRANSRRYGLAPKGVRV